MKFIGVGRYRIGLKDEDLYEAIKKVNWKLDVDYWRNYNATTSKGGKITFGASGGHGEVAIFDALVDCLPKTKEVEDKLKKYYHPEEESDNQTSLEL